MDKLIRKVYTVQFYSFFNFYWGYYFNFYFSAGYLFYNKIYQNLSNENRINKLLLCDLGVKKAYYNL